MTKIKWWQLKELVENIVLLIGNISSTTNVKTLQKI